MAIDGKLAFYKESQFPRTSKLGRWEDIEHELAGLVCEMYGSVQQFLRRQL
jgi:hypothetical protein